MLRNRLTASSGDRGSSHGPVLATTHFPLNIVGAGILSYMYLQLFASKFSISSHISDIEFFRNCVW